MGCCGSSDNKNKKPTEFLCPKCGNKGAKVGVITPKSLLKESALERFDEKRVYRFCTTPSCDVVYFSDSSDLVFTKDEVKVKVTIKDESLVVNVCYCFGYTRQSILDEIEASGSSKAVEDISAKMKDPGCSCDILNPQGGCCLKNVKAWIKEAGDYAKR